MLWRYNCKAGGKSLDAVWHGSELLPRFRVSLFSLECDQIGFYKMSWYTHYRTWPLKNPIKRCPGLRGTNWDLNASHTPLMQKRHTTLKNGWETAETLRNHGVYSIDTKNLNNLNKTCWQKVRKIHKHTHSNLLQIGDEDENTIVDQTVSINTILLLYNSYSYY